jgi:hypothetical protein
VEHRVLLEMPDPRVLQDYLVRWVLKEVQDHLDQLVFRVQTDSMANLVHQGPQD